MAEKQKIEDYKNQVRYLEKEIEELERDRMLLRYRLRDISSLYSKDPGCIFIIFFIIFKKDTRV